MSTTNDPALRERVNVYGIVATVMVIMMIIGLFVWQSARSNREAEAKADQLVTALELAGARTPSRDQIVRLLGNDGGAVCADPTSALSKASLLTQLANGAGGPGARPVIAESRFAKGEVLVISVYCPEQLPEFQQFIDGLKTSG